MTLLFVSGRPLFSHLENAIENGAKEVPTSPHSLFVEGWKGHWLFWSLRLPSNPALPPPQGMVLSAEYIKKKLEQEMVLSQAFGRDLVSCP